LVASQLWVVVVVVVAPGSLVQLVGPEVAVQVVNPQLAERSRLLSGRVGRYMATTVAAADQMVPAHVEVAVVGPEPLA
jgi:hypothetical protein